MGFESGRQLQLDHCSGQCGVVPVLNEEFSDQLDEVIMIDLTTGKETRIKPGHHKNESELLAVEVAQANVHLINTSSEGMVIDYFDQ